MFNKTNTNMKNKSIKNILFTAFLLFAVVKGSAQTIDKPTFEFERICADSSFNTFGVTFKFYPESSFTAANQFIVEMFDASGSSPGIPIVVYTSAAGEVSTPLIKPISFAVPTTIAGEKFKLRVKSTSPALTSPESNPFAAYYKPQNSTFSINNSISTATYCKGSNHVLTIDNPGTRPNDSPLKYPSLTFDWYKKTSETTSDFVSSGPTLTVTQPGTYYVRTNYGACTPDSYSYSNEVTVEESSGASEFTSSVNVPASNSISTDETLTVTATTTASNPVYKWYLDGNPITDATSATYLVQTAGSYKVAITQTAGCVATKEHSFTVTLKDGTSGFPDVANIPNFISPNGDGINDTWQIPLEYINEKNTEVLILNSKGDTVLKTNNYQNNWPDSPLDFKNVNPVYYYIITTVDGKVKKGSITVVK